MESNNQSMGYLTENDAEIYVTTWMKFEELEASTDGSKPKRDGKANCALGSRTHLMTEMLVLRTTRLTCDNCFGHARLCTYV